MTATVVKSTKLTAMQLDDGAKKLASGRGHSRFGEVWDSESIETTSLDEEGDAVTFGVPLPLNCVIHELIIFNSDLDSDESPELTLNVGIVAAQALDTYTSGTKTSFARDDVIDADFFAASSTIGRDANLGGTNVAYATRDLNIGYKRLYEQLGYDSDPGGMVNVRVTVVDAAATAQAGKMAVLARYSIP